LFLHGKGAIPSASITLFPTGKKGWKKSKVIFPHSKRVICIAMAQPRGFLLSASIPLIDEASMCVPSIRAAVFAKFDAKHHILAAKAADTRSDRVRPEDRQTLLPDFPGWRIELPALVASPHGVVKVRIRWP
jgi:hypothetical protein